MESHHPWRMPIIGPRAVGGKSLSGGITPAGAAAGPKVMRGTVTWGCRFSSSGKHRPWLMPSLDHERCGIVGVLNRGAHRDGAVALNAVG